ncbi:MAG: hypothetical protein IPK67_01300 [Planctomycetes bacterium]|nr:hypothetical protein [Planctomycetota bacterium]
MEPAPTRRWWRRKSPWSSLRRLAAVFAIALAIQLSACTPIHCGEQGVYLRHDPAADTLTLLVIYDSVTTPPHSPSAEGPDAKLLADHRAFAERIVAGERVFMIHGWPFVVDLESLLPPGGQDRAEEPGLPESGAGRDAASADSEDPRDRITAEALWILGGTKVLSSGFCTGSQGRLSIHQEIRFRGISRLLELARRAVCLGVIEQLEESEASQPDRAEAASGRWDARTRELMSKAARVGRGPGEPWPWITLGDGHLSVDVPMSQAYGATVLKLLIADLARSESDRDLLAGLLSHLESIQLADEHLLLRWKADGPLFTFPEPKDFVYDGTLARRLGASLEDPPRPPTRSEIVERFLSATPKSR